MKTILFGAAALAGGALMVAAGFAAAQMSGLSTPVPSGGMDKTQIESIVHNYLIENPEVLVAAQAALVAREEQRQQLARADTLRAEQGTLFKSADDGVIGNPDGSRTIVEFFDYNCGYCKHALADMETMVEADPELRFILKEFPILGPDSQAAHYVSAAVRKLAPDLYPQYHMRLLGSTARADEASAMALALELGLDEAQIRQTMGEPAIEAGFKQTFELAEKLAITGTPAYVVGNDVVFGAVGAEELGQRMAATN